jgi:dihydrofolate reductase
LKYFQKTTTTTSDPQKQNAVIMGRNTRLSIPEHRRPLPKRVNCVLSHLKEEGGEKSETTLFCSSFDECLHILSVNEMIENIFVI